MTPGTPPVSPSKGRAERALKRKASSTPSPQDVRKRAAVECPCALGDKTDWMAAFAKRILVNMTAEELGWCIRACQDFGRIRVGSVCSGSGCGETAAAHLVARLAMLAGVPTEEAHDKFIDVVFMCESDDKKAAHLRSLHSKAPIFKDVGDMGGSWAKVWHDQFKTTNGILVGVPPCDLFISGWSCKDLSLMSCNSGEEMTDYIRNAITAYIEDMDKETPAYEGTTLPTLIGSMKYIYHHRPQFILMENVIGANGLLDLIGQFFVRCGYQYWHTQDLCPSNLSMPNSRPRVYILAEHSRGLAYARAQDGAFQDMCSKFVEGQVTKAKRGHVPSIYDFLLPREHPHLKKVFGEVPSYRNHSDSEGAWTKRHLTTYAKFGCRRPDRNALDEFWRALPTDEARAWFASRPLRDQEVAYLASKISQREGSEVVVDTTQNIDRVLSAKPRLNKVPCFTDGSEMWFGLSMLSMTGAEALSMMGMSPQSWSGRAGAGSFELVSSEQDELFKGLAGNAFHGASVIVAVATLLQAYGQRLKAELEAVTSAESDASDSTTM